MTYTFPAKPAVVLTFTEGARMDPVHTVHALTGTGNSAPLDHTVRTACGLDVDVLHVSGFVERFPGAQVCPRCEETHGA